MKQAFAYAIFLSSAVLAGPAFGQGSAGLHDGHGGSGSGGATCAKLRLDKAKLTPAHLAEVRPGSSWSLIASGIDKPENLEVTVKGIPVTFTAENKGAFYRLSGSLPAELKNTHARINIKLKGRANCLSQDGWLIKISDSFE